MLRSHGLKRILSMIGIAALPFAVGAESPSKLQPTHGSSSSTAVPNWAVPAYWSPAAGLADELGSLGKAGIPSLPIPFVAVQPCRFLDTRGAPIGGGIFADSEARNYTVTGQCAIPAGAKAVSANFTVTLSPAAPPASFLLAWPQGGPPPPVSILNFQAGQTVANAAIVPMSATGGITVNVSHSTHVIMDVNGYFGGAVTEVQQRVSGTCAAGSSIRAISATGTVICETDDTSGAGAGWSLTGNAGTNPATNFLGTTDFQALELRVDGQRALRIEPAGTSPNFIAGSASNFATTSVTNATVGGGFFNSVTDNNGTVAGGTNNQAGDGDATVTNAGNATVSGGGSNVAGNAGSTVGGGSLNLASGALATIGGGNRNTASGQESTVPGGVDNVAAGNTSFAAGLRSLANHHGVFAWGDSSIGGGAGLASTAPDQFIVRSIGGIYLSADSISTVNIPAGDFIATSTGAHLTTAGVWTNNSDRDAKEAFESVDSREVLRRLAALPITSWSYKVERGAARHVGPTAQDFREAFGLGLDAKSIGTIDADGVALAAIQGLYELLLEKEEQLVSQGRRLAAQEEQLRSLKSLEARLNALETKRTGSLVP